LRIVHLSDIHIWRYSYNPTKLFSKRAVGILELLKGRAKRFRLERLDEVVARVQSLQPDHVLITGDLTTTALRTEFVAAREALTKLLHIPGGATVIPGNHDRYTSGSVRSRKFEQYFGEFGGIDGFPFLKHLDPTTVLLGLDPTRSHISARGFMPEEQLLRTRDLLKSAEVRDKRLIVACHYPLAAPSVYERELNFKRLKNTEDVVDMLRPVGPHLFCCGHVHAAWAFTPVILPEQLCLNSGAPLLRDNTGNRLPGFLQIDLEGAGVTVTHQAWTGVDWLEVPLLANPKLFEGVAGRSDVAADVDV
jgi:3',5'-cyclic AMP phosphodiesterase CpdA